MIARVWKGITTNEHSDAYQNIIITRDIPDYKKTKGFVKLTFLKHSDGSTTTFKLITIWEDYAAVKNFTGPQMEQAVGHPADRHYLIDYPGSVMHYEVFA